MKKIFLLMLLPLSMCVVSCGDDSTDDVSSNNSKEVSVTSSANVLSYSSVSLKGYANGANGKVGFCYSATNTDPDPETCAYVETSSIKSDNSYELTVEPLKANTKYYYRAFATKDQMYVLAKEVKTFTTDECKREAIDLGLSVKWANYNVGANAPEEYGDYFAWGETTAKTTYDWSTYKYCNGSYDTQSKYCTSNSYGTVDNKTVLESSDDAATVNWGGSWRMPTDNEMKELFTCTWTWTTLNGVDGYKVTGKNGNSIFLPAAGQRLDSSLDRAGSIGGCWSVSLSFSSHACCLFFNSNNVGCTNCSRCDGRSVRPVCQ